MALEDPFAGLLVSMQTLLVVVTVTGWYLLACWPAVVRRCSHAYGNPARVLPLASRVALQAAATAR